MPSYANNDVSLLNVASRKRGPDLLATCRGFPDPGAVMALKRRQITVVRLRHGALYCGRFFGSGSRPCERAAILIHAFTISCPQVTRRARDIRAP